MANPTRRRAFWVLIGLAILAVVVVGVDDYLHSQAFRNRLEAFVVEQIEQGSGARVEVSSLSLSFRPLRLELDGLVVHGREAANQSPLAVIPRLQVDISIISLWRRQLALTHVVMQQPRFHIYRLPDGNANLPEPNAANQRHQQEANVLFALGAKRLEIAGGVLSLEDQQIPLNLGLDNLTLRMSAAPQRTFTAEVAFHRSAMRLAGSPPLPLDVDVRFTLWPSDIRLDEIRAETPGVRVTAQGWLRHFLQPQLELAYHADVDLSRFTASLNAQADLLSGRVLDNGALVWSPHDWTAHGVSAISAGRWGPAGPSAWSGQGVWQASRAGLRISKLDLTGPGGANINLHGTNTRWQIFDFDGNVVGLHLADLRPVLPRLGLARQWLPAFDTVDSRLSGTFQFRTARPRTADLDRFTTALTLAPGSASGRLPLAGTVHADFAPASDLLDLQQVDVMLAGSHVQASGSLRRGVGTVDVSFNSPELAGLRPFAVPLYGAIAPGQALPDFGGAAQLQGTLRGALGAPIFTGSVQLARFRLGANSAEAITASGSIGPDHLILEQASYRQGGQQGSATGLLGLENYRVTPVSTLRLQARASGISLDTIQRWAGVHYPLTGALSARATISGTWSNPQGDGAVELLHSRWRNQTVQTISADVQLRDGSLSSTDLLLQLARTRVTGSFQLGLRDHSYTVKVASNGVQLSDIALLQSQRLAIQGMVRFQLSGNGRLNQPQGDLVLTTTGLRGGGESLGDLGAQLHLVSGKVQFQAADILPNGSFNLAGSIALAAPYPVDARLQLRDYDFDAWLRRFTPAQLTGHSRVSGTATLRGPLAEPNQLAVQIALDPVEMAISGLSIHNQGAIQLVASQHRLTLQPAHIVAPDTDFTLQGSAVLGATLQAPVSLDGQLSGRINLALVQSLHPSTLASGTVTANAKVTGTTARPLVQGQVAIQNASLAEADFPIALDNIQGELALDGRRVEIRELSAHTGSGTLALTGFAAKTAAGVSFDLGFRGQNLRLRYQGISASGDLQLRLNGQSGGGLLAGNVQLNRVGLDPNFDLAQFIASTQAAPAPPNPDSLLNLIRMDIHLVTGSQVEVVTNMARLQFQADIHLRGTLANPVVLGRASASEGSLLFAGNQYQVTKAQVQFINPFRIEPLLDVALSTTVQQYDVTLNISGPADKLAITYRSDPPLSSSDVVALLATGEPTQATSTLAGSSSYAPSEQLLGQALGNLVSGRLQRLFGITQVQVNPDTGTLGATGSGGTVTIQQQVSRNLKLTYTQNLSSSSEDIVQVEWTISRFLGVTLNRDQYGLYGLQFTFRHRAR